MSKSQLSAEFLVKMKYNAPVGLAKNHHHDCGATSEQSHEPLHTLRLTKAHQLTAN